MAGGLKREQMAEENKPDTNERQVLEMAEVLVLVKADTSQALVERTKSAGVLVTHTTDVQHALMLAREKHFTVIILDLDTPSPRAGLEHLQMFGNASPASSVLLVCSKATFENAADGFRRGAADVVDLNDADYLKNRLVALCLESKRAEQRDQLLLGTLELHDQFLRRLMEAHRRAQEAEETAAGQSRVEGPCVVLVVDDNPRTAPGLERALESGFRCVSATNGGEALDYATNRTFDVALVKQSLPDLSGGMVARTLRSQIEDGIVLLFEHPGKTPGFVSIIEANQSIELIPELRKAPQLVDRIRELHLAVAAKRREKRHLQSFRRANREFLKSFVGVRKQIQQLLPDGDR
jgi:DNA-binding response OmpR family regulator